MTKEVLDYLQPKEEEIYLDCTLGSGGHSQIILESCPKIQIIAFDQDPNAISRCQQNPFFSSRPITFINDNFLNFPQHLALLNVSQVAGFLFDLGVSSEQLADSNRGFSYRLDAPLDMRMDARSRLTAHDIVNNYRPEKLANIFWEYGEERRARKIAQKICQVRTKEKITTTQQLVRIVAGCQEKKSLKHPARRVFQALRIAVNQELNVLAQTVETALQFLKAGGKIIVISYHSLEDRIVKQVFRQHSKLGFQILTKKPLTASQEEVARNRRARSAKMRVIVRLSDKKYPKYLRKEVKKLDISNKDLEGELDLSDFTNLEELNCASNDLTEINLKNCRQLKILKYSTKVQRGIYNRWNNSLEPLRDSNLLSLGISNTDIDRVTYVLEQLKPYKNESVAQRRVKELQEKINKIVATIGKDTKNFEELEKMLAGRTVKEIIRANQNLEKENESLRREFEKTLLESGRKNVVSQDSPTLGRLYEEYLKSSEEQIQSSSDAQERKETQIQIPPKTN
ncbi:21705_t:CDS:2 [Gigaspora margarita]|uniref:21705_t:CDS:1 n=1 Tax=Gigaspora margarita TaxID=4874 RepID=A0ABM8VV83_GIGMA|nr:21705_t:CDS:2 [Gigaspora margarita]